MKASKISRIEPNISKPVLFQRDMMNIAIEDTDPVYLFSIL